MAGIFISYRRGSTSPYAGRLHDRLSSEHGRARVFMDVDAIDPGVDFAERIRSAVATADATLVIIGSDWLTVTDARGRRRLDDPGDFVRIEVAEALGTGRLVIPVLVEGARIPAAEDLPEPIRELSRRNAVELRDARWSSDVDDLAKALRRTVPARRRRIGWRLPALAAVGATLIAVAAVVVLRGDSLDIAAEAPLGGYPVAAAISGGKVWVATQKDGRLTAVDERTAAVAEGPKVGTDLTAVAAAPDHLWVGDFGASQADQRGTVTPLDASGGQPGAPIETGDPFELAADATSVWALDLNGTLDRIDVRTRKVTRLSDVKAPFDLALADGVLWVIDNASGELYGFDAATGAPRGRPLYIGPAPVNVAAAGAYVWVAIEQGQLVRVTIDGGAKQSVTLEGEGRRWIEASKNAVWIADEHRKLVRLNAGSLSVEDRGTLPEGTPEDIVLDGADAWVLQSRSGGSSIVRVSGSS